MQQAVSEPVKPLPQQVKISPEAEFDQSFKPTGAITFFVLLVLLGLAIWFGIYFLMLDRV
jgi:hypothetical protein